MKKRSSGALRAFLGIVVAAATALLIASVFNFIVMPLLVRKGQEIEIPVLVGLSRPDAERELTRIGLRVGNVRIVPSTDKPAGCVVSQFPKPGRRVKLSRMVDIDIASDNSYFSIPEIIGLPLANAIAVLEQSGFAVARVESLRSPGMPSGQVVRVEPAPGTNARRGSQVVIAVSTRVGAFPMPNLIGMDQETAQGIALSQGLVLGPVKVGVSSERPGSVIFQFPEEGMSVSEGDTISLIIAGPLQEDSP